MKAQSFHLCCAMWFAALLPTAVAAANLIQNGDFNSGLAPWIAPSGAPSVSGGTCSLNNASIRQTVATIAGHVYFFAFDAYIPSSSFESVTFTATPGAG